MRNGGNIYDFKLINKFIKQFKEDKSIILIKLYDPTLNHKDIMAIIQKIKKLRYNLNLHYIRV